VNSNRDFATCSDGTKIFFRVDGKNDAPRVALLHSLAMDHRFWQPVVERLANNAIVLSVDCRGHGRSDKPSSPYSTELFARDLSEVLDHIGWRSATVAGASMGGCVSLAFASSFPDRTDALGLIDTTAWYGPSAPKEWAVRADKAKYGAVRSVTYASARTFLAGRPDVVRYYDALEGSSFYSYWDPGHLTYRQVYFEDERSAAQKYEYAITTGLAGVGLWTLGNDAGYPEMADALEVFYAPDHEVAVSASINSLTRLTGSVRASLDYSVKNLGDVPERGEIRWRVRNEDGRQMADGTVTTMTVGIGKTGAATARISLGSAADLPAGTWTIEVFFVTPDGVYASVPSRFRQPF